MDNTMEGAARKSNYSNRIIYVRVLAIVLFFASLFRRKAEVESLVRALGDKQEGKGGLRQARPYSQSLSPSNSSEQQLSVALSDFSSSKPTSKDASSSNPEKAEGGTTVDDNSADDKKSLTTFPNPHPRSTPPLSGGVIVFYHIYKTGGTTIRQNFAQQLDSVQLENVRKGAQVKDQVKRIDAILKGQVSLERNQTYFLEMHIAYPAPRYPNLVKFSRYVKQWKALSKKTGVPFFSFAMIRDPVDYAISYFNFFYVQRTKWPWSPYEPLRATEENFVYTFVPNRQTLIMGADPVGVPSRNITQGDFDKVNKTLCSVFDWVGTTEKIQTETLPLLSHLVTLDTQLGTDMEARNVQQTSNVKLHRSELSNETIQLIEQESQLDRELYNSIAERFSIEKMHERFGFIPQKQSLTHSSTGETMNATLTKQS